MSALVRITVGIMPQHSRVGMTRAMTQFGEVIHCHKPPYSGIPGEDFVNVRFASQDAADRAYAALKGGTVFVDGFQVGVGPAPGANKGDALMLQGGGGGGQMMRRRSESPPRRYARGLGDRRGNRSPPRPPRRESPPRGNFPSRNDPKSPSPRRIARDYNMSDRTERRSRSRSYRREPRYREMREERNEFSIQPRVKERQPRSPSPDPPGPVKNLTPVMNPFFRQRRSPSPDELPGDEDGHYASARGSNSYSYHQGSALPPDFAAP